MKYDHFCEILRNLKVDTAKGPPKPYKPLLMLAVLILIRKGKIQSPEVLLDGGLKSVFRQLLNAHDPTWRFRSEIIKQPFTALSNDGVWSLIPGAESTDDFQSGRRAGVRLRDLLKHVAFAQMDEAIFLELSKSVESWLRAVSILIGTYGLSAEVAQFVLSHIGYGIERPQLRSLDEALLTERAVEEYLETNWRETPFAAEGIRLKHPRSPGLPGRQVITPINNIDLLGWQKKAERWWVFELKRRQSSDSVVGQVSRYLGWINDLPESSKVPSVGVVLVDKITTKLECAVKPHASLQLWKYDVQEDGVGFEQVSG